MRACPDERARARAPWAPARLPAERTPCLPRVTRWQPVARSSGAMRRPHRRPAGRLACGRGWAGRAAPMLAGPNRSVYRTGAAGGPISASGGILLGVWRSLVARKFWVLQVAGSNPAAPTSQAFEFPRALPIRSDGVLTKRSDVVHPAPSSAWRFRFRASATDAVRVPTRLM